MLVISTPESTDVGDSEFGHTYACHMHPWHTGTEIVKIMTGITVISIKLQKAIKKWQITTIMTEIITRIKKYRFPIIFVVSEIFPKC